MTDNQRENSALTGRDSNGRWCSSEGNKGRPLGCKNKASRAILETVKSMAPAAMQRLYEAVDRGERWAVELVLSKTLPATRTIELEALTPLDIQSGVAMGVTCSPKIPPV